MRIRICLFCCFWLALCLFLCKKGKKMSFINLDCAKPFVKNPIFQALQDEISEGNSFFDEVNPQVDLLINLKFGFAIPADNEETKYHLPASLILQKLAKNLLSDISEEFSKEIEEDYQYAISILENLQIAPVDNSKALNGTLGGLDTW